MQQIYYEKEGLTTYMVIPCEAVWEQGYVAVLMAHHKTRCFLPCEIRNFEGQQYLYYRMHYRTTAQAVVEQIIPNVDRIWAMIDSIIAVYEEAEEYLLDANKIHWSKECVYMEADTGYMEFCYNFESGGETVQEFVAWLLEEIGKKDRQAAMVLLQFYNVITEPGCTLQMLKEFRRRENGIDSYRREEQQCLERRDTNIEKEETASEDNCFEEKPHSRKRKQEEEKNGVEKFLIMGMLLAVAANLVLLLLLLGNILPYSYMPVLFVGMAILIVLTLSYMGLTREESPEDMMCAYEKEQQEEWQQERREDLEGWETAMQTPLSHDYGNSLQMENPAGETTVLGADRTERTIVEQQERALQLVSFLPDRYAAICTSQKGTVIGSMENGCDYVLKERGISRMHAKLIPKADGLYLLDLNSTNGTYLNGEPLLGGKDYRLEKGDMVAFGDCEFAVAEI